MKITIECECGNNVVLDADYGKPQKEFRLHCDKCGNWIAIDLD